MYLILANNKEQNRKFVQTDSGTAMLTVRMQLMLKSKVTLSVILKCWLMNVNAASC
jgi:hypothetical protein